MWVWNPEITWMIMWMSEWGTIDRELLVHLMNVIEDLSECELELKKVRTLKLMKFVSTMIRYGGPSCVLCLKNIAVGTCTTLRTFFILRFLFLLSNFSLFCFNLASLGEILRFTSPNFRVFFLFGIFSSTLSLSLSYPIYLYNSLNVCCFVLKISLSLSEEEMLKKNRFRRFFSLSEFSFEVCMSLTKRLLKKWRIWM